MDNHVFLYTLVRVILGLLLFMQGFEKVFVIGLGEVRRSVNELYAQVALPKGFVAMAAGFASWLELIIGLLLIIGLFTQTALILTGVEMLLLAFSFSLRRSMWDMRYWFPRLVLLLILLWLPLELNIWSVDVLLSLGSSL